MAMKKTGKLKEKSFPVSLLHPQLSIKSTFGLETVTRVSILQQNRGNGGSLDVLQLKQKSDFNYSMKAAPSHKHITNFRSIY